VLRFAVVFSVLSFVLCGSTYLLLRHRLKLQNRGNRILLFLTFGIGVLIIVGPFVYRAAHASIQNPLQQALQFVQYFLMGWTAMTLLTFASAEILNLIAKILARPFDPSKRIFFTEGVARGLVAGTSIAALGGLFEAEIGARVDPVEIRLKTLPAAFDGFVIAQISDIHLGPLIHEKYLDHVVDRVMALQADAIVITGDLVDGTVEQLRSLTDPLKRLKAKDGVYFCTGNHEYYSGAEAWIAFLQTLGIHVFQNSNVILDHGGEKLMLAGVHDWQAWRTIPSHKADPVKAAQTDETVGCKILLAHNPKSTDENSKAGFHLQLSGHTHAGQFYPFVFLAKLFHRYFEGLYPVNDSMQVYVNRGTGYWGPPNRLGKRSEITRITLKT